MSRRKLQHDDEEDYIASNDFRFGDKLVIIRPAHDIKSGLVLEMKVPCIFLGYDRYGYKLVIYESGAQEVLHSQERVLKEEWKPKP